MRLTWCCLLILLAQTCIAQRDSLRKADSTHWRIKNPVASRFWGNSLHLAADVNFSRHKEYGLSIGRTCGISWDYGRGMRMTRVSGWGLAYSVTPASGKVFHGIRAYAEYTQMPPLLLGTFSVRTDYLYQLTNGQHYLRPSAGLSLVLFDLQFNYSFLLNGSWRENLYRQGFTLRLRQFPGGRRKWERRKYLRRGEYYFSD